MIRIKKEGKPEHASATFSPDLRGRHNLSYQNHYLQRVFGNSAVQRYMKHHPKHHPVVQAKLIVEGKEYDYDAKPVQWTLDHFNIQETGRRYLQSIIESENDHVYKRWGYLGYDLRTKDNIKDAASEAQNKVGFALGDHTLDETYWDFKNDKYVMKGDNYAKAVDAIFKNMTVNRLECDNFRNVIAIRAFQLSVGDAKFNTILKRRLKGERLTIPFNDSLLTGSFSLDASTESSDSYNGEKVFRPGDMVQFSLENLEEADNTRWQIENAIVVDWNDEGEPLFKGGGVIDILTEHQMKVKLCNNVGIRWPKEEDINKIRLERITTQLTPLGGLKID